jgi:hypothetical protein
MDRRRLRTLLALFNVEGDVSPVSQFIKRETLQRVFVKVHLAAALLEDEAVSFYWEQFADHAAQWRDRRRAHLGATTFLVVLAEFDSHGVEGGSDGFFERLIFLAGGHGLAAREGDDDERLGDVGLFFVVGIFRQGDSPMNQILVPPLEVCHAGFNLSFPPRSHIDISTFNFQIHAASVLVHLVYSVCLVCLVYLVYLVFWLNETN